MEAKANVSFTYGGKTAAEIAIKEGHREVIMLLCRVTEAVATFLCLYHAMHYSDTNQIGTLFEERGVSPTSSIRIPFNLLQEKAEAVFYDITTILKDKRIYFDQTIDITPMDIAMMIGYSRIIDFVKKYQYPLCKEEKPVLHSKIGLFSLSKKKSDILTPTQDFYNNQRHSQF